jgi:hypothetical protein
MKTKKKSLASIKKKISWKKDFLNQVQPHDRPCADTSPFRSRNAVQRRRPACGHPPTKRTFNQKSGPRPWTRLPPPTSSRLTTPPVTTACKLPAIARATWATRWWVSSLAIPCRTQVVCHPQRFRPANAQPRQRQRGGGPGGGRNLFQIRRIHHDGRCHRHMGGD